MAAALAPLLPGADAETLARAAVEAMLPEAARLTEQCGVRFRDGRPPVRDVALVGACDLAQRLAEVGPDEHVHRVVLMTPWRPAPAGPVATPATGREDAPEALTAGREAA